MTRKLIRGVLWTAGGLVALVLAVYVVALTVNWRDREPSEAAVHLDRLYRDRPAVADAANAYVYVMGFAADGDPRAAGLERLKWIRAAGDSAPLDLEADPAPERTFVRPPEAQVLVTRCPAYGYGADCVAAFDDDATAAFDAWTAADGRLLERYRELLAHDAWREDVSGNLATPFPPFARVLDGQRLMLLQATVLAQREDAAQINALLASDLRFWRTVLGSSDTLLTKMIAVAAVKQHFRWGNLVLRKLPRGDQAKALPEEWRTALTDSERSISRTFAGEWAYASVALPKDLVRQGSSLLDVALAPLYRRQDTLNQFADRYVRVGEMLDAPLDGYAAAVESVAALRAVKQLEGAWPRSLYNLTGSLLFASESGDFGSYGARAADVEGVRRAALATTLLRAADVQSEEVAAALAASELRNPYDGQPLLWDAETRAVVFRGLEPGERGENRFYY